MENTKENGRVFIAYKGNDITEEEIKEVLNKLCSKEYTVKCVTSDDVIFAKIVHNSNIGDIDPYRNRYTNLLSVNGYNQDETIKPNHYVSVNHEPYCDITNYMYNVFKKDMFQRLGECTDICSVIWDENRNSIIAGATNGNGQYTHLYYGYTKKNQELIYSNNDNVLTNFCDEVIEMPKNTYMKNGKFYTLDGKKVKDKNMPSVEKLKKTDYSLGWFTTLFLKLIDKSVKSNIEKNIEDCLSSDEMKKKFSDFLLNNLDKEIQKTILTEIKKIIVEHNLEESINNKLEELFNTKLQEYTSKIQVPIVNVIKLNNTVLGQTKESFYHEKFEEILENVCLDEPIMLIGPAGSGKNVAIKQVADALGLHMYYTNNASNEFKLTGFIDAGGNYRDTEFYKAFKNGGIFFLDEIDTSDPSSLIVINSALANGYMAFPHETIDRHKDFRIIAAANTWGKGADLQYVGRNILDAATLDRFDNIFFDYDTNLERALYPNEEVLQFMWSFRDAVYQSKIPHVVSTRGIGKVYKKEINNKPVNNTLTSNVVKNLGQDDVNTIIGNMKNITPSNKYYDGIKQLRLKR